MNSALNLRIPKAMELVSGDEVNFTSKAGLLIRWYYQEISKYDLNPNFNRIHNMFLEAKTGRHWPHWLTASS